MTHKKDNPRTREEALTILRFAWDYTMLDPDGFAKTIELASQPAEEIGEWTFHVYVGGCTAEQAARVMTERIFPDEDYGFPYTIGWSAEG